MGLTPEAKVPQPFQTAFYEGGFNMEEQITGQCRNDFYLLFTEGGILTNKGKIFDFNSVEQEALLTEQRIQLNEENFISNRFSHIKNAFPEVKIPGQTFIHIIKPDTLSHMSYALTKGGSTKLIIHSSNLQSSNTVFGSTSISESLANYVKNLKRELDPNQTQITGEALAGKIMKELIDEHGVFSELRIR